MTDDLVGRLRANLPSQLLKAKRWLVWRGPGKDRVPYYVSGRRRFGTLDSAADVARLATFASAVKAFRTERFAGFGFALGPDGDASWQGIDLDGMRQDGKLVPEAESIVAIADTYTEVSPSGEGVHLIGRGKPLSSLTNDGTGVERYAAQRYFTMTGLSLNGKKLADLSIASAMVIEVRQRRRPSSRAEPTGGASPTPQGRNVALTSRAGHLRNAGLSGTDLLDVLHRLNAKNVPPLPEAEVAKIAKSADRSFKENVAPELYSSTSRARPGGTDDIRIVSPPDPAPRPQPMRQAAYHGPVGQLVRLWSPTTEASCENLLTQTLVALSAVPDGAGVAVPGKAKLSGTQLFLLVAGPTSTGRKGTAKTQAMALLEQAFPEFVNGVQPAIDGALVVPAVSRVLYGLSSGEGLVHAIRDAREFGKKKEEIDEGSPDKRLLVIASEFSLLAKVGGREGSTLSEILRQAFDGDALSFPTKRDPLHASRSHLSLIAHCTVEEIRDRVRAIEMVNGSLNRFLPIYVERDKVLADIVRPDSLAVEKLASVIRDRLRPWAYPQARERREVELTPAARTAWRVRSSS